MAKTCGNCVYAKICKKAVGSWFSPKNIAYCEAYKDSTNFVEVVRCKDCKYCRTFYPVKEIGKEAIQVWYCDLYRCNRKPDEFCSDGERREGE